MPEWQRTGNFLLLAAALHAAILCYPLHSAVREADFSVPVTILAHLADAAPSAPTTPRQLPPAAPPAKPQVPHPLPREHPATQPTMPLASEAIAPIAPALPTAVTVTAPATAAPGTATPGVATSTAAPVAAPRFDAAYLKNPAPKYPLLSRRLCEEGKVLLKVRVSAAGLPSSVELEKSSSHERLDAAAREIVAQWRFLPARRGEEAVEASVIVPIVFRLDS